jgi:DNA polymerase-3 subunit beta
MKVAIARADLADAASWVAAAVPKKPAFTELGGIRVTAVKGRGKKRGSLTLEGYDFEVGHTAVLEADVLAAGVAVVPGFLLRDLTGVLPGETVALELEDRALWLRAGRSQYRLAGFDPEAYPNLPVLEEELAGTVDADALRLILGRVAYACDDDNPSSTLKGVRLEAGPEDHLYAVGAVSASIGAAWAPWATDRRAFYTRVPESSLTAAVKGLTGPVDLSADSGTLALMTATRTVTLRQYADDQGPMDWRRMIPPAHTIEVVADRGEVSAALTRARLALAPAEGETGAPVRLSLDGNAVTISASGSDSADGTEVVDVELDGQGIDVSFGADLLMRALTSCPDGPVILRGTIPGKPFTVTDKSESFILIVLPRRS